MSKRRHLLWIPQVALALTMAGGGAAKVFGDPAMVTMFADIGAGQWFRYAVGALEIAGGVGLLIPRLAPLAALGLALLLAGAAVTNVVVLGTGPWTPLALLAVAAAVGWYRFDRRRRLAAVRSDA
jgi:putative oxidoreductase